MELLLDVDAAPGRSKRARLEHALREAVRAGQLPVGARLPPTRQLATDLGVSRGVVAEAYSQLAAEGWVQTARGGGTRVAPGADAGPGGTADRVSPPGAGRPAPVRFDLDPTLPAVDRFPRAAWHAALGRVLRDAPDSALGYGDPRGEPALRAGLAASLGRRRGVRTDPETLLVTGGVRRSLPLAWSLLSDAGVRRVAVEAPGWKRMAQTARRAGLDVVPLPVDEHGLVAGLVPGAGVDAVALTPAHQYPTGAVLSAPRRSLLVAWARERRGWIVEDDFDAEFRYDRSPVGALQGLAPDVVVHSGSASKLLAPALRLGWLVLPPALDALLPAEHPDDSPVWVDPGAPSTLDQLAYADLLERGELDRHLRGQRRRYAARRKALLDALGELLPDLPVTGAAAGLFVVLRLPDGSDEDAILARATRAGLRLEATGGADPGLAVGYATLPEPAAKAAVRALRDAIGRP